MDGTGQLILLVIVGFLVGIINTLSGGGSLLTLPLLIFFGLPSNMANGTNRIAILLQNIFALMGFRSKGATKDVKFGWYLAVFALIGSLIGSQFAITVRDHLFNKLLAIVMIIILLLMLLTNRKQQVDYIEKTTGKHLIKSCIAFFIIGLYGGFIQAGTGIFILMSLSFFNNISLVKSNIIKAMVMLVYTMGSLVLFWKNGLLNWEIGLVLASGQSFGAWVSSRWSVNKDDKWIKILLTVMVVGMSIKLWFFN